MNNNILYWYQDKFLKEKRRFTRTKLLVEVSLVNLYIIL